MKLSKLITYKHMVDGLSVNHIHDTIETLLKHVNTDLSIQNIDFYNLKHKISTNSDMVLSKLNEINADILTFKSELEDFLKSVEEPYYAKSQAIYQEGLNDKADYILDRHLFKKLLYQPETQEFFTGRIKLHSSWRWPGMEIRPAYGEVTNHMTALDPLYLVDTDEELFKIVKTLWTPEYRARLRYYTINERDKKIFHQLPLMQFGLIVATDFFNFRPIELIERYLKELFQLLRPGGVLIFTYNNCDYPIGVDNFENSYYCYTPGRQVKEIAEKIGYRVAASFDLENNVSWLELERLGARSSLRGGQTLGRIMNI